MNKTSSRKVKSPVYTTQYSGEEIRYFPLEDLLPEDHILALNTSLGTLSLLTYSDNRPRMLCEQQFTTSEIYLLLPLLKMYPDYCPHDVLLSSFINGTVDTTSLTQYKVRLQNAQEKGTWDQELRPLRNILSRARAKLRAFGIEISSVHEAGYSLMSNCYSQVEPIS